MNDATGATHVCIVRHGESEWNVEKRIQGQMDPPLSDLGERQAQAVARRLSQERWDAIYSSDLARARLTAEAIAQQVGLQIAVRTGLRERAFGRLEGILHIDARAKYPDWDAPELGRETEEALSERARSAFEEIVSTHPGQRVLVVTHGGLIRQFLGSIDLDGMAEPVTEVRNTSVTRLEWGSPCRLLICNDIDHLLAENLLRLA